MVKNAHLRQIEQMESEELMTQKKLRTEVIQLEDMLSQVRKEYEMLRIEFEGNLAANEQTGPINKEMRNLIQSLQTHNVQLKGEVGRYKRKSKEGNLELMKLRKDLEEMKNAEIRALQVKKEAQMKAEAHDHLGSGSPRQVPTPNAGSVINNLSENSQDGSNSSPNHSGTNAVHSENNHIEAKNSGNGDAALGDVNEMNEESSNGPVKVINLTIITILLKLGVTEISLPRKKGIRWRYSGKFSLYKKIQLIG